MNIRFFNTVRNRIICFPGGILLLAAALTGLAQETRIANERLKE